MGVKLWKREMVHWMDAQTVNGWHHLEPEYKPVEVITIGWVVQDDKQVIALAASIIPNNVMSETEEQAADVTVIPKGMVTKRTLL